LWQEYRLKIIDLAASTATRMVGQMLMMHSHSTQPSGTIPITMVMAIIRKEPIQTTVSTNLVLRQLTALAVSTLMVTDIQMQMTRGRLKMVQMHFPKTTLNGLISMKTVLVTITEMILGQTEIHHGLENIILTSSPINKMLAQPLLERHGKTTCTVVLMPMATVGTISMTLSSMTQHNTATQMAMDLATTNLVSNPMHVSMLQEHQQSIDLVALIPMAMVTLTPTLIRIIFQRTELTHFMKNLHNGQTVMVMDLATTLKD
jgi:hypothetical protein